MPRYSIRSRVAAVFCYIAVLCDLTQAAAVYSTIADTNGLERPADLRAFIQRNWDKFFAEGTVHDLPHAGPHLLVPDDEVRECAAAFKEGYTREATVDSDEEVLGVRHYFYTSMAEACEQCEVIRRVMHKYDCSPDYLLRRMKQLDPNLKKVRLDYKIKLNPEQMASRQQAAAMLLERIRKDPTFLLRVCWIDEWHVWCTAKDAHLKVWADAHDSRVHEVLPTPQLKKTEKPIVIRCVAMVNAILGPIHMEFTTGTTDLQRDLLKEKTEPYKVGANQ